jgi:hypothetical protein
VGSAVPLDHHFCRAPPDLVVAEQHMLSVLTVGVTDGVATKDHFASPAVSPEETLAQNW